MRENLTFLHFLTTLGALMCVFAFAWMWQQTIQDMESAPPLTRRQWIWNVVGFVCWLAFVALVLGLWALGVIREEKRAFTPQQSPSHRAHP